MARGRGGGGNNEEKAGSAFTTFFPSKKIGRRSSSNISSKETKGEGTRGTNPGVTTNRKKKRVIAREKVSLGARHFRGEEGWMSWKA